jgi:hypothetical protein
MHRMYWASGTAVLSFSTAPCRTSLSPGGARGPTSPCGAGLHACALERGRGAKAAQTGADHRESGVGVGGLLRNGLEELFQKFPRFNFAVAGHFQADPLSE